MKITNEEFELEYEVSYKLRMNYFCKPVGINMALLRKLCSYIRQIYRMQKYFGSWYIIHENKLTISDTKET
jgi:hypothetical protein